MQNTPRKAPQQPKNLKVETFEREVPRTWSAIVNHAQMSPQEFDERLRAFADICAKQPEFVRFPDGCVYTMLPLNSVEMLVTVEYRVQAPISVFSSADE